MKLMAQPLFVKRDSAEPVEGSRITLNSSNYLVACSPDFSLPNQGGRFIGEYDRLFQKKPVGLWYPT